MRAVIAIVVPRTVRGRAQDGPLALEIPLPVRSRAWHERPKRGTCAIAEH